MGKKSRVSYDIRTSRCSYIQGYPQDVYYTSSKGYQVTYSLSTGFLKFQTDLYRLKKKDRKSIRQMDHGSFFHTSKAFASHPLKWTGSSQVGYYNYRGDLTAIDLPSSPVPVNGGFTIADRDLMIAKGATAIARVEPLNPLASATTALAELRKEGLPKLAGIEYLQKSSKKSLAQKAGSDYLNTQFAALPLVSDVNKLVKSVRESEKIISQVHRDSGKLIRRRYSFPLETSTSITSVSGNLAVPQPALASYFYRSTDKTVKTTEVTTERQFSFSGAFTYYLPPGGDLLSKVSEHALIAHKLYGAEITPEVVYNLTPWSWALDWVTNTGDNIHNMVAWAQYGLIMPYGYVMMRKKITTRVTITGLDMYNVKQTKLISEYGVESKTRYPASPIGFGYNTSDFSAGQWSIIGALGLTMAPGKLRNNGAIL